MSPRPPLSPEVVAAERRRLFVDARAGISLPVAGAVYWLALGAAGFALDEYVWCLVAFSASGLIFPLGLLLSKPLGARLLLDSPLAGVVLPALVPVGLSFGVTIPAFYVDPTLVPLSLAVGMSLHWPVIGWLYGRPEFVAHAVVRVLLAVALWVALPGARFTALPLAVGAVYCATVAALWVGVRRAEAGGVA